MHVVAFLLIFLSTASAQTRLCAREAALDEAAAALAEMHGEPNEQALEDVLRGAGSDLPQARALRTEDSEAIDRWLAQMRPHADSDLVCGEARDQGAYVFVAGERAGELAIDGAELHWSVHEGFDNPRLAVIDEDGRAYLRGPLRQSPVRFDALDLDLDRIAYVQLVGVGPRGPRPIATRVWRPLRVPTSTMTPDESPRAFVIRERHRFGMRGLRDNALLSHVASEQAAHVRHLDRTTHLDAQGRDPETRVRAAGLSARAVGEVVSCAASVSRAMDAAFLSPSHRAALLDPRFSDAGIGLFEEGGRACVVVLLASWPRPVG